MFLSVTVAASLTQKTGWGEKYHPSSTVVPRNQPPSIVRFFATLTLDLGVAPWAELDRVAGLSDGDRVVDCPAGRSGGAGRGVVAGHLDPEG
jgi:hypothetical protein